MHNRCARQNLAYEYVCNYNKLGNPGSSNGRTLGFGPKNLGSNPGPGAKTRISLQRGFCFGFY